MKSKKNENIDSLYEKHVKQKNNFPIAFYSLSKNVELLAHWHEHIEILFFKKGKCRFTCSDKKYIAEAGDFIFVNSKEIHSHYSPDTTDYICLLIYPEFFSDIEFGVKIQNFIKGDKVIAEIMGEVEREYSDQKIGSDMKVKGLVYVLMSHLVRNYSLKNEKNQVQNLSLFSKAENYIELHYNEQISRSDIAKICFVSDSYISKYFKNITGRTVTEYINEYKISKAVALMKDDNLTVSDIAMQVGFEDLNYFSRVFKKVTSMSPTEYKKRGLSNILPCKYL